MYHILIEIVVTWNNGFLENSSPKIQPHDQTSIAVPYRSSPSNNSGGLYQSVITLFVYGRDLSSA